MTGTDNKAKSFPWISSALGLGVALVGFVFAVGLLGWQERPVDQPFPYNHAVHTAKADCVMCHRGVRSGPQAGLPDLVICTECHAQVPGKSPTAGQKKLWDDALAGKEVPAWNRLYRLPTHVYFSHRRHVQIGGLECAGCHGDMASQTKPPRHALKALHMRNCLACHQEKQVTQDCTACHR